MNASEATNEREDGSPERSEARMLARYSARDDERTKPSVMLLDWIGDDEVTVRWETVRRDLPAAAFARAGAAAPEPEELDEDFDFTPRRFRGIGSRAGGIILGVVLGAALTIGLFALFVPDVPATNSGTEIPVPQEPYAPRDQSRVRPVVTPVPAAEPGALATAPR